MSTSIANQPAAQSMAPENIGQRLELFVDDAMIDNLRGARLRLHAPVKTDLPSKPLTGAYITVIHATGRYGAYYREYLPGYTGAKQDGNNAECTCYSESTDGINWDKPALRVTDVASPGLPNVVWNEAPYAHNLSPFLDRRPGVPDDQRFKALAGTRKSGLHAFASADGLRWRKLGAAPVIVHNPELHGKNAFDSQNVAFWSAAEQCYVAYFRHWNAAQGGPRTIGRAVSDDFMTWRDCSAGFRTPNLPGEELYTSQTHPYFRAPHVYIALPTRFTRGYVAGQPVKGEQGQLLNKGSTDIMFMSTRAGAAAYCRLFHEAFIRPGLEKSGWENRANYVALNVVPLGADTMAIYNRSGHRYMLRTDGFVSLHAPYAGGELTTKPLIYKGRELVLNLSTAIQGGVRVELQDAAGRPCPGLTLADCDPLIDDAIERVVTWGGRGDIARWAGQPVRLRFALNDADVYSYRFR